MDERIYTERQIVHGVLLGGPLAGAYYLWHTFNAFGLRKQAIWSAAAEVAVLAFCLGSSYIPLLDLLPNFAFWGLQIGVTYGVIRGYLAEPIAAHLAAGKPVFGWGNTILIGIIFLIFTFGPLLGLVYLSPNTFDPNTTKYYGRLRHEIAYIPAEVSEVDVGRVANALTETGFFDELDQKFVDLRQYDNKQLVIIVYCTQEARATDTIDFYRRWRDELQRGFPDKHIVVDMVVGTPDDRIVRLE
jgi:hypothetical protein